MALVPLSDFAPDESTPTSSLTTLSRLLLTYICNSKDDQGINQPVSTAEIFDEFKDLFSGDEICSCLEKMLLRDHTYTWRRPIYYHCNAIADNKNIFDSLKEQWKDANSLFLDAIKKYLEMYKAYIKPINPNRENIAKELENIVERLLSSSDEYDWLRVVRCVGDRG